MSDLFRPKDRVMIDYFTVDEGKPPEIMTIMRKSVEYSTIVRPHYDARSFEGSEYGMADDEMYLVSRPA